MSTLIYCDSEDCNNSCHSYDGGILSPASSQVAQEIVDKGWFCSIHDLHICRYCIENYFNEEDEQLKTIDNYYFELGEDFIKEGDKNV